MNVFVVEKRLEKGVSRKLDVKRDDQRPKSTIVKIDRKELEREVREGGRTRRDTHKAKKGELVATKAQGAKTERWATFMWGRVMDQFGHNVRPSTDETVCAVCITALGGERNKLRAPQTVIRLRIGRGRRRGGRPAWRLHAVICRCSICGLGNITFEIP